jgi:hypothetical protein
MTIYRAPHKVTTSLPEPNMSQCPPPHWFVRCREEKISCLRRELTPDSTINNHAAWSLYQLSYPVSVWVI